MTRTRLSIDTLIAVAPVLGATLEDRATIRDKQSPDLLPAPLRAGSIVPQHPGPPRYYYGCLDFLPFTADGRDGFQLLEFNGTGMGGLTNLPWPVLDELLGELARAPAVLAEQSPLIVMPLSVEHKRGLLHERLLVAQALAEGLMEAHGAGRIWLHPNAPPDGPAVAIGYPPPLKAALTAHDGRLTLAGRTVHAAIRDLFCQHITDQHADGLTRDPFFAVNALYPLCASKPRTYALYNQHLAAAPSDLQWRPVAHWIAASRDELIAVVLAAHARGLSLIIKPHASGAARGIEFLPAEHSTDESLASIDAAIADAERSEGDAPRPAFPYVACELLSGRTVPSADHPLHGHRFELRIVVYRVGDRLHVFPAVAKLSGRRFDPAAPIREMLLNTVSASAAGGGHLLPLCNADTLAALGLSRATLTELCDFSLRFVAHAIAEA